MALNVSGSMELTEVLQSIADSICDHASWQICWIYAMDLGGGFGEIIARQDRLHYTEKSRVPRWDLDGSVSSEALRREEIIIIPDLREAADFPTSQEWARSEDIVAAVTVPLRGTDPLGRRMVLSLRSRNDLLRDPFQLSYIKAAASLISLAASNAALLDETRRSAVSTARAASLLAATTDAVASGCQSDEQLRVIEQESEHSVILFDRAGNLQFAGTAPPSLGLTQDAWEQEIHERRSELYRRARALRDSPAASMPVSFGGNVPAGEVVGFGGTREWAATGIVLPWSTSADAHGFASVNAATAMVLLRDRIAAESESLLQKDVFSQILEGTLANTYEFTTRAGLVGLATDHEYFLVVARDSSADAIDRDLDADLRELLRRWPGACLQFLEGLHVFFVPARLAQGRGEELLHREMSRVHAKHPSTVITSSPKALPLDEMPESWKNCLQILDLAQKIGRTGLVGAHEFGSSRFLLSAMRGSEIAEFISETIGPLMVHQGERHGDLCLTAEAFMNAHGRYQETARQLNVHVSTLRYRLSKISELLGKDLEDPDTRFDLTLAMRFARLQRGSASDERKM
jgi:purine catabolism regulator